MVEQLKYITLQDNITDFSYKQPKPEKPDKHKFIRLFSAKIDFFSVFEIRFVFLHDTSYIICSVFQPYYFLNLLLNRIFKFSNLQILKLSE